MGRPHGVVYVLHIEPAYRHARHYVGWAASVADRLAEHLAGRGARLTQVAVAAGRRLLLVRCWPGTRRDERRLKDLRNTPRRCNVCRATG